MKQALAQAVNLSFQYSVKEKLARMGTISVGVLVENSLRYMAQYERDTYGALSLIVA